VLCNRQVPLNWLQYCWN